MKQDYKKKIDKLVESTNFQNASKNLMILDEYYNNEFMKLTIKAEGIEEFEQIFIGEVYQWNEFRTEILNVVDKTIKYCEETIEKFHKSDTAYLFKLYCEARAEILSMSVPAERANDEEFKSNDE